MGTSWTLLADLDHELAAGRLHVQETATEWTAARQTPDGPRIVARWQKARQSPGMLAMLAAYQTQQSA